MNNDIITPNNYLNVTKLNWLYIDINSYFATIEQQVNPDLRNKPIIVVAVLSDYTSVIAASFDAKLKGIKTGTKVKEAKSLCPELICILANHKVYVEYHKKIFAEVEKYLPVEHIFSIDEAACRLTADQCNIDNAIALAKQIKLAIRQSVGEYISCSIGIAPNRYLAKIATDMQKPDGLVVITPEDIPNKIYSVKLRDLPGVGRNMHNRLNSYGITTVEKLYNLPAKLLRKVWGSITGEKLWYLLRGADLPFEQTKSSSISHSQVLALELRISNKARDIAVNLILKAAQRLRKRELYTSSIILVIRTQDDKSLESKIKLKPSADDITLSKLLLKIWDELIKINKIVSIKKIAITLSNLETKPQQLTFDDIVNKQADNKKYLLSQSIDKLNNKYGSDVVKLGKLPKTNKSSFLIAFQHIPKS
ncbi:MAG TPA: DNA-directed DNA polymerase [Rickettsia endosymbiont of Omalisus fontisbellaquei]|nr:DNA-directed DNA polymerase [Rickettsia endosymbiont of Omalisus fontisbellaquei]